MDATAAMMKPNHPAHTMTRAGELILLVTLGSGTSTLILLLGGDAWSGWWSKLLQKEETLTLLAGSTTR
jgi:hypothetical protein